MYIDYFFIISTGIVLFFTLMFIFAYFSKPNNLDPKPKKYPGVSVVIPIWNEERTVANTLETLIKMKDNYKGNFEIIVVDNNSKDKSVDIVKKYVKHHDFIKLDFEKQQGKSFAFNHGTEIARYDLVANVDADSYPNPDSLNHIVGYFDDAKTGAVTTKMIVRNPKSLAEKFQDIEYIYSNFLLTAFDFLDSVYVARGPLSVYRKSVLLKIGGFLSAEKTPAEDMEITFRIRKSGYAVKSSKTAKVYTSVMSTWKKLFWQRIRWNRGSLVNFWMHRDMALDSKYGFFGIVMMPTVSITIFMIWVILYYLVKRVFDIVQIYGQKLFWYIYMKQLPNFSQYFQYHSKYMLYLIPVLTLLILVILGIWFMVYFLGFVESKEKLSIKRFIVLILSPIIYMPCQIVFWLAAIYLQIFKYKFRWR